jgi:hypothetical protein
MIKQYVEDDKLDKLAVKDPKRCRELLNTSANSDVSVFLNTL